MIRAGEPITILGAGLTGSLLAIMLARRGAAVTVLERSPDPRLTNAAAGRSINLAMAARGMKALKRVGLDTAIAGLMCPMPGRIIHDLSGELQFQRYGSRPADINYSVSREGLNRLLIIAAEDAGARIRFQQRCDNYDAANHQLSMCDLRGESLNYMLSVSRVIGADGAGSPLRRALDRQGVITASEHLLGHRYQEIAIPPTRNNEFAMPPEGLHVWPRGEFMLIALPNPGKDFTATLFMPEQDASGGPSFNWWSDTDRAVAFLHEQFPDLPPLVSDLADQVAMHPLGVMGTIQTDPWHYQDKCLLVGDAAHAIVPFHGQGMNAAFEDCVELDALVETGESWLQVFADFSKQRPANANAIAQMALENYKEMRDVVRDPDFQLRKALALHLESQCPEHFVSRYSMVMFHADISYATALERGALQSDLLKLWTKGKHTLDDIDLESCEQQVKERLTPINL